MLLPGVLGAPAKCAGVPDSPARCARCCHQVFQVCLAPRLQSLALQSLGSRLRRLGYSPTPEQFHSGTQGPALVLEEATCSLGWNEIIKWLKWSFVLCMINPGGCLGTNRPPLPVL